MNVAVNEIPSGMLVPLAIFVVIQIAVEVFALVKLFRTPDERLVFEKKWPWVLIIVFVNLVGAIVFLAAGRKPAPAADPLSQQSAIPGGDRATRAADVLYGRKDGER